MTKALDATIYATPAAADEVARVARAALPGFRIRVVKSAVSPDPLNGTPRVWQMGRSRLSHSAAEKLVDGLGAIAE